MDNLTYNLIRFIKQSIEKGDSDEKIVEQMKDYMTSTQDLIAVIRALIKVMKG